jgi:hypothetical protein
LRMQRGVRLFEENMKADLKPLASKVCMRV